MGVMRPELVMKSIVPVVMAGVLGIYGLIIAVIISTGSKHPRPLASKACWTLRQRAVHSQMGAGSWVMFAGLDGCISTVPCLLE